MHVNQNHFFGFVWTVFIEFFRYILYENYDVFESHFAQFIHLYNYRTRNIRNNLPQVLLEIEKYFTISKVCKLYNEIYNSFWTKIKKTLTKIF